MFHLSPFRAARLIQRSVKAYVRFSLLYRSFSDEAKHVVHKFVAFSPAPLPHESPGQIVPLTRLPPHNLFSFYFPFYPPLRSRPSLLRRRRLAPAAPPCSGGAAWPRRAASGTPLTAKGLHPAGMRRSIHLAWQRETKHGVRVFRPSFGQAIGMMALSDLWRGHVRMKGGIAPGHGIDDCPATGA